MFATLSFAQSLGLTILHDTNDRSSVLYRHEDTFASVYTDAANNLFFLNCTRVLQLLFRVNACRVFYTGAQYYVAFALLQVNDKSSL